MVVFLDTERGLDTFGYGWIRLSTFLDTVGYDHRFFGYGQNFGYGWIRLDTFGYGWRFLDTFGYGKNRSIFLAKHFRYGWIRLDTGDSDTLDTFGYVWIRLDASP